MIEQWQIALFFVGCAVAFWLGHWVGVSENEPDQPDDTEHGVGRTL